MPTAFSWPTCPRCRQKLGAFPVCPGCGLSLAILDEVYGGAEVVLNRVSDAQEVLGEAGRSHVEREIDAFDAAFPQAFLVVHVGLLGSGPALRQFGFWLLNRGALAAGEITRPNENGVVLVIDPLARLAGMVVGYQLEMWLPESVLEEVLNVGRRDFQDGRVAEGAARIVRDLRSALREALRSPAMDVTAAESPAPGADLRRLREGDRLESKPRSPDLHDA